MAKQNQRDIRRDTQTEGRRINQESDQLMQLLYGRLGQTPNSGKNDLFNEIMQGYRGAASGGAGSIGNRPNFGKYEAGFGEAARTGLLDEENKRRIRGGGVFDEYAKTGGYSEGDKENIRSRATRSVPGFYDSIRQKMKQQAAISGEGPAYSSSMSRLSRDASRGASEATQDAELGIMDRVNEGRQWGAGSMSSSEQGLAELISRNKLGGLSGGLQAAQAGGDFDIRNRGLDLQNRGLNLQALGGMGSLFGQGQGDENELLRLIMGGYGQRGQLAGGNLGQRASYDPNVSFMDRLAQFLKIGQSAGASYAQSQAGK